MEVATALTLLDAAEGERKRVDQEIGKRARANPEVKRLRTIPGVGPLTALALLAILGDLSRFSSLDQIVAFVGLCPSVNQSGKRRHLGHITRAGDGTVLPGVGLKSTHQRFGRHRPALCRPFSFAG